MFLEAQNLEYAKKAPQVVEKNRAKEVIQGIRRYASPFSQNTMVIGGILKKKHIWNTKCI